MIPIYLELHDFMGHKKSEIEFERLSNAIIIVGTEDGSSKKSNAVGKTTLFKAIKYVLFNAKTSASKDKVIREGAKKCLVKFIFSMSDGKVFKIERTRTKNSGDVMFFEGDGDVWIDRTQRRNTDTDASIVSLIGMNAQTFDNTAYFRQGDTFNLASATPEKRKIIIREMLDLSIWEKYKKEAQKTRDALDKDLLVTNTKISQLSENAISIETIENKIEDISKMKSQALEQLVKAKSFLEANSKKFNKFAELATDKKSIYSKYEDALLFKNEAIENYNFIVNSLIEIEKTISINEKTIVSAEKIKKQLAEEIDNISKIIEIKPDEALLSSYRDKIAGYTLELRENIAIINNLSKDLPDDLYCPTCSIELNDANKETALKIKEQRIEETNSKIAKLKNKKEKLQKEIESIELEIVEYKKNKDKIYELSKKLSVAEIEIQQHKKAMNDKHERMVLLKEKQPSAIQRMNQANELYESAKQLKVSVMSNQFDNEIKELQTNITNASNEVKKLESNINSYSISEAMAIESLSAAEKNKKAIQTLNYEKDSIEYRLNLYKAVFYAFSSKGIPFMIVNSVLDAIQSETNKVLDFLRNGLQIQFVVSKEKENGTVDETLGMKFFVGSDEWDWDDLSGGQQGSISLALKFATAVVNRKRCGADVRLLMLDEVDQPLDEESIDRFYDIIKEWSKDMTIMVITHNAQLKEKFDNFIVVKKEKGKASAMVA